VFVWTCCVGVLLVHDRPSHLGMLAVRFSTFMGSICRLRHASVSGVSSQCLNGYWKPVLGPIDDKAAHWLLQVVSHWICIERLKLRRLTTLDTCSLDAVREGPQRVLAIPLWALRRPSVLGMQCGPFQEIAGESDRLYLEQCSDCGHSRATNWASLNRSPFLGTKSQNTHSDNTHSDNLNG
jgi:hypothetical protein